MQKNTLFLLNNSIIKFRGIYSIWSYEYERERGQTNGSSRFFWNGED